MYGEVAWSDPAPFAVPSVVEDVALPAWGELRIRVKTRHKDGMTILGAHGGFRAITRSVRALLHDDGG
jgi:hypothetical protein